MKNPTRPCPNCDLMTDPESIEVVTGSDGDTRNQASYSCEAGHIWWIYWQDPTDGGRS